MGLPSIFNYDIIFALFLSFFVMLGAHKGFEKMLKLVLIFVLPILILYYFGSLIHQFIPPLPFFDQVIISISNVIPTLNLHIELIKYIFIETILYFVMALILASIVNMVKVKTKKALLQIKLQPWKKIVGAILSVILFYVFSFYLIFPLQLFGLSYQNSLVVQPMLENGIEIINVAPLLKHKDAVKQDYNSFVQVESSLLGHDAKNAYDQIVQIQNEIFTYEMRFMEVVYPVLRTNARDALLANKTFSDPVNTHRGIASALIQTQGSLIFYDLLIALEQESTNINVVRSEYNQTKKYQGMIIFFYDILNGEILLDYESTDDTTIKNTIDSFVMHFSNNITNDTQFENTNRIIFDWILSYYLYGNLMTCAMNEEENCSLSVDPLSSTPKQYQIDIRPETMNHSNIDRIISYATNLFDVDQLEAIGLTNQLTTTLLTQKDSFNRYLTSYKELVNLNEYSISFANKIMMAMMDRIQFKDMLLRSMMIRAYINDLGSNYQNKTQAAPNIYISSENFNINMALIDIIFHTEIWNGEEQMNVGDMERLIDKVQYYLNNRIITMKFAEEMMNHFIFGKDNYYQSYFIDLIEANQVTDAALSYLIESNATFISQDIKDYISTYLP